VTVNTNAWGAMVPGKPAVDYAVVKPLTGSPDWQTVSVRLGELVATDPKVSESLTTWRTVTELSISPSGTVVRDGQAVKVDAKAWMGPRAIRNLRWEGGEYPGQAPTNAALRPDDFQRDFNDAIKKSLEQENRDRSR
jgi:hypothetical protein